MVLGKIFTFTFFKIDLQVSPVQRKMKSYNTYFLYKSDRGCLRMFMMFSAFFKSKVGKPKKSWKLIKRETRRIYTLLDQLNRKKNINIILTPTPILISTSNAPVHFILCSVIKVLAVQFFVRFNLQLR